MDALKPCPWCGDTRVSLVDSPFNYSVRCWECDVRGPLVSDPPTGAERQATEAWNRRPLEDAKDAEIARLKASISELKEKVKDALSLQAQNVGVSKRVQCAEDERDKIFENCTSVLDKCSGKLTAKDAEIARLRALVEDAYDEGYADGGAETSACTSDDDWGHSQSKAALAPQEDK